MAIPTRAAVVDLARTPIYRSVLTDLKWHPGMLRPTFDVDAVIAASYDRPLALPSPSPRKKAAARTPAKARASAGGRSSSKSVPVKSRGGKR